MATVRTVLIKPAGGGDFTSLIAWQAASFRNLVASDEIERVICYSGGNLGAVNLNGWTMDATHYMEIIAAPGEQHSGVWDYSKAYITSTSNGLISNGPTDNVFIRGLQIELNNAPTTRYALRFAGANAAGIVEKVLLRRSGTAASQFGFSTTGNVAIRNSIAYNFDGANCIGFLAQGSVPKFLNCTAYNCQTSYVFNFGAPYSRNCLSAVSPNGFISTVGDHDYHASDLPFDAPGTHSRNSQTFSFVDAAARDLHLLAVDQGAVGHGEDLSATFTDDIDGFTRVAPWDIGADQAAGVYAVNIVETSSATESLSRGLVVTGNMAEAASPTDSVGRTLSMFETVSEQAVASDAATFVAELNAFCEEVAAAADYQDAQASLGRAVSESMSASDFLSIAQYFFPKDRVATVSKSGRVYRPSADGRAVVVTSGRRTVKAVSPVEA